MKLTKKIIAIVLATLTVLSTFAFAACSGGPKGMAVKFVKASLNGDLKTGVAMIHPDVLAKLLKDADLDEGDLKKLYDKYKEEIKDNLKDEKITYTDFKCTDVDEKKTSEIKNYKANYNNYYDWWEKLDLDITDMSVANVKYYWKEGSGTDHSDTDINFIKVGGKWYLGISESASIISLLKAMDK